MPKIQWIPELIIGTKFLLPPHPLPFKLLINRMFNSHLLDAYGDYNHILSCLWFQASDGRQQWSEVAQPCLTLCNPMDCSLLGSSVHEIFQARILEWVAISFSSGSSQSRDRTQVSHIVGRCFYRLSHQGSPDGRQKTVLTSTNNNSPYCDV